MLKNIILLSLLILSTDFLKGQSMEEFNKNDSIIQENINNQPNVALEYIKKQEHLLMAKPDEKRYRELLFTKADCMNSLGLFDESLKIYYSILHELEIHPTAEISSKVLYQIGLQYFQMGDHNKALETYQKAKQIAIENKIYLDTIKINLEIGLEYASLDRVEEGVTLLKKNIEIAKKLNNESDYALGCDNLSNVYHEIGDFENSLKYQMLFYLSPEAHDNIQSKVGVFQHLTEIYISLKKYKEAQYYLDSAFYYVNILKSNDWLYDCHKNQFQIDEALGKTSSALYHHKQYLALKDSVYRDNYDTKMSALANFYDLVNKENKINTLELDTQLNKSKIQSLYLLLLSSALIMLSSILYLLYIKSKREKEMQIYYSAQLLESQEKERQRIARELHDSVGQNILFIKNQIKKLFQDKEPPLTQSIDNVLEEVRNISKDLYPNQLERFGLESAVETLAKQISLDYNIFVSSDLQGANEIQSKNISINLYRIIQEFINNSLKHAEAKAIRITSTLENGILKLVMQDNGKGFDLTNRLISDYKSFGLINVEERVKLMNGKIALESKKGIGTKFEISIPL